MPHLLVVAIETVGEHLTEQAKQFLLMIPRQFLPLRRGSRSPRQRRGGTREVLSPDMT
jgi:hypothetical protein